MSSEEHDPSSVAHGTVRQYEGSTGPFTFTGLAKLLVLSYAGGWRYKITKYSRGILDEPYSYITLATYGNGQWIRLICW